jgi:5'-methylthioadenosine phosphorylase
MHQNSSNAEKVVRAAVAAMPKEKTCACGDALKYAILTDRKTIPTETRQKLALLLDKYL